jgi:hypothetical protein
MKPDPGNNNNHRGDTNSKTRDIYQVKDPEFPEIPDKKFQIKMYHKKFNLLYF